MPVLNIFANDWAMQELPVGASRFWSWTEMLEAVCAAGFTGMQAPPAWGVEVRRVGLAFAAHGRVNTPDEVAVFAQAAKAAGARFATLHVGWGSESDAEMDALACAVLAAEQASGLGLWPETHRATMLQDMWRTLRLLERFPALRLNLDVSHYYCGGEFPYRQFAANHEVLRPILRRAACFHGRVSNGQTMQVPLADLAYMENVRHFALLWSEAMTVWRSEAMADAALTFIPELGPPSSGYALTVPDPAMPSGRRELSDRWTEMQALARLARALFAGQDPAVAAVECQRQLSEPKTTASSLP